MDRITLLAAISTGEPELHPTPNIDQKVFSVSIPTEFMPAGVLDKMLDAGFDALRERIHQELPATA